jgi:glycosyltransferase involved in cell wall biosynthesis
MTTHIPVISVVVPTYNRATLLANALRSITEQTFGDWEVIVVDNHSVDHTDSVVHGFADPRIILTKVHNDGVIAVSRNRGIALARGEFVAFLDADDWWSPGKLEASVAALRGGADLCYHDMWVVTHEGQRAFRKRVGSRPVSSPVHEDLLTRGNAVVNSSVVVRASVLRQIGGLSEDPTLIATEDFDCWLRIAEVTDRFHFLKDTYGYYWVGGGNETNPKRAMVYLRRLHELHIAGRLELGPGAEPEWWLYAMARASYLTGERGMARRLLWRLMRRRTSLSIKSKVLFMLAAHAISPAPAAAPRE